MRANVTLAGAALAFFETKTRPFDVAAKRAAVLRARQRRHVATGPRAERRYR